MDDKTKFFQCESHAHAVGVEKFDWQDDKTAILLTYWSTPGLYDDSFKERLKLIWDIINGNKHIYYDLLLTKQQAKELGEYLIRLGDN